MAYNVWPLEFHKKQDKADMPIHSHDNMEDLHCMSYTSKGTSELLVAGLQDQMFTIDVDKGVVTAQVVAVLKIRKYLAKQADTYERSVYENETKPIHLCCNTKRLDQYSRFGDV